jgi:membrane protein implicated in regulation of membrane protease activity
MLDDVVFAIIVGSAVGSSCFLLLRWAPESAFESSPTSFDRIGSEATVTQVTSSQSANAYAGRVRVGNESWRATFLSTEPNVGDSVRVIAREGMRMS